MELLDIKTLFLNEFNYEAFLTRRMLDIVPFDRAAWKPHTRSMEIQELAKHIATIPTWVSRIITTNEFDHSTNRENDFLTANEIGYANEQSFPTAHLKNTEELLALFDANTAKAVKDVEASTNESLMAAWTMRDGERIFFSLPRLAAIRNMAQSHAVHHRGQLSVYLRLLNIPLPSVYGSTADVVV